MIDIENDVFNLVANAVKTAIPTAYVSGEYDDAPASFPAVTIVEQDNYIYKRMRSENIENAVVVMFEVNVYSSRATGRKSEAKEIMEIVDSTLTGRGFTRSMKSQVPNLANSKVYRIVARYSAVVGSNSSGSGYLIYQNDANHAYYKYS